MSRPVKINGKWPLLLPDNTALEWETNMANRGTWEMARLEALESLIRPRPIVLYIGAYKGDMPALLASWGAKLILVEGSSHYWPIIKETWEINGFEKPLGMYSGLMSNETTSDISKKALEEWPTRSEEYIEGLGFAHLAESKGHFPELTVDDLCLRLGVVPDIITADCEGSEYEVLKGATAILKHHPKLVLSVHPEFMITNHDTYERELHNLLEYNGYAKGVHLDYDHEHHYKWEKA